MRRWLIAIFALHFLLNVGLFAFGQIETHSNVHGATVAEQLAVPADPAHGKDLLGHAPDHGLTDTQPELPEWLDTKLELLAATPAPIAPDATQRTCLAPPTLDGPQRPPRLTQRA